MSIRSDSFKSLQFDVVAATVKRIDLEKVFSPSEENKIDSLVRPNFIQIKNENSSDVLYLGDESNVSSSNYRLAINPLATGKSINLDGFSDLYLLCSSNTSGLEINYAFDDSPSASDMDGTQDITVINQSLTVTNVGVSSIASGNNTIGKVKITDGTDDVVVEADGSINVNVSGALAAGDNNIGNVDIDSSLPAGDNNIGNVDLASAIPAGSNKIGSVDIDSAIPAGDNNIGNVDIASSVPAGTNNIGKVVLGCASGDVDSDGAGALKVAFVGSLTASSVTIEDSGSDELAIESDGSINANLQAGNNVIGKAKIVGDDGNDILGNIDDSYEYGYTSTDKSIMSLIKGILYNQLSTIDAITARLRANSLTIYNVTCTTADTEYSQTLASYCKKFTIGLKSHNENVTWILKDGTAGNEFSMQGNQSVSEEDVYLASKTLYFETDTDGEVVQIMAWN
jgi:hypothetical protein